MLPGDLDEAAGGLQIANWARDLALFNLAIDSKLRRCDLVALPVGDAALGGLDRAGTVRLRHALARAHKAGAYLAAHRERLEPSRSF